MKSSKSLSYLTSTLSLTPAARSRVTTVRYVGRSKTAAVQIQRRRSNSLHTTSYPQHQHAAPPASSATLSASPSFQPSIRKLHINEPNYDFVPSSSSTTPPVTKAASQSSTSSASTEKATFFTPTRSTPRPPQSLPAFFGAAVPVARRSNLVLRNGAYGIPKASLVYETSAKGKGKELPEVLENDHPLSIGIGEDAVRCTTHYERSRADETLQQYFLRTDALGVADGVGGWSGHAGANPARWSKKLMQRESSHLQRELLLKRIGYCRLLGRIGAVRRCRGRAVSTVLRGRSDSSSPACVRAESGGMQRRGLRLSSQSMILALRTSSPAGSDRIVHCASGSVAT